MNIKPYLRIRTVILKDHSCIPIEVGVVEVRLNLVESCVCLDWPLLDVELLVRRRWGHGKFGGRHVGYLATTLFSLGRSGEGVEGATRRSQWRGGTGMEGGTTSEAAGDGMPTRGVLSAG